MEVLVQKALAHFGRVDVLVNNAGFYLSGLMEHTSLDERHRVMQTNFWGYVHTIQALLPQFLEWGSKEQFEWIVVQNPSQLLF